MATRLGPLVLLLTLLSQCGVTGRVTSTSGPPPLSVRSGPPRHISLYHGESRTFRPGALRPGDVLVCRLAGQAIHIRIPNRPGVVWSVGTGIASANGSSGLEVTVNSNGSATASCGRKSS